MIAGGERSVVCDDSAVTLEPRNRVRLRRGYILEALRLPFFL